MANGVLKVTVIDKGADFKISVFNSFGLWRFIITDPMDVIAATELELTSARNLKCQVELIAPEWVKAELKRRAIQF